MMEYYANIRRRKEKKQQQKKKFHHIISWFMKNVHNFEWVNINNLGRVKVCPFLFIFWDWCLTQHNTHITNGQKKVCPLPPSTAHLFIYLLFLLLQFFVVIYFSSFLHFFFVYSPNAEEDYNDFWHILRMVGFCLSFANSCTNPVALYCVSDAFRKHFNRWVFVCVLYIVIMESLTGCVMLNLITFYFLFVFSNFLMS